VALTPRRITRLEAEVRRRLDRETARRLHADAAAEGLGQGVADQPTLGF
jgi:hypothetical protein